jgi:hypothetical protein
MSEIQKDILQDLRSGVLPSRFNLSGYYAKAGEKAIFAWNGITYHRQQSHAHWVGGSQGVSVRIMRGVSYRVGAHNSHREVTHSMDSLGTGTLAISNLAISFPGEQSFRILFKHIMAFQWYRDGFGFETDAANNNHYIFSGLAAADVDFVARVTTGLSDLDTSRHVKDALAKTLTTAEDMYRQVVAFSEQHKITPRRLLPNY